MIVDDDSGAWLSVAGGCRCFDGECKTLALALCNSDIGHTFYWLWQTTPRNSLLEDGAGKHRASLEEYSLHFDQLISIVTTSTLLTYTFIPSKQRPRHLAEWCLTPFVFYFCALSLFNPRENWVARQTINIKDIPADQ